MSIKKPFSFTNFFVAVLLFLGLLLFVTTGTASAHATVIESNPDFGVTIAKAPPKLTVEAAENINPDPKLSNLLVYGPARELVSQGNATIPLNKPNEMSIPIKADGNGIYVVQWKTVSALDGDSDQGAFAFIVDPAVSTTSAAGVSSSSGGSFPFIPVGIAAIIALLIGVGVGFGIGRSRGGNDGGGKGSLPEQPSVIAT